MMPFKKLNTEQFTGCCQILSVRKLNANGKPDIALSTHEVCHPL